MCSKLEHESLEKRVKHVEDDMNSAFTEMANQMREILNNRDKIDGHTNLLKAHQDIITEL
jgi:esterase/lipase